MCALKQGGTLEPRPEVPSFYPLSPQRREWVRVRGEKKNLLATSIDPPLHFKN
jgi:hypothetical protein